MRSPYGRFPGPGDLGLRELAEEEEREEREARENARAEAAADDYMSGGWQDEDTDY